jgi:hypothetical protein
MTPPTLDRRSLNRALLARQWLLGPRTKPQLGAVAMIEHLVGLQAQAPNPPYFGLWSRIDGFVPAQLSSMLLDRTVVRASLMRGTIHLVTADDCLALRSFVQPFYDRDAATGQNAGRKLRGFDTAPLVEAGRALLHEQPRTLDETRQHLGERWPDHDPIALAHSVHDLVPLVQVPPRGVWGVGGQPRWTTTEAWLDRMVDMVARPEQRTQVLRRYLGAFGPASVMDVQAWSGLTGLGELVDRVRDDLIVFRDENGRELFDLPDAPRPAPDTPAPPRLVAEFDNLTLAHADRTRIVSDADRKLIITVNGTVLGTVLIDGFVAGRWKIARRGSASSLNIEPFRKLATTDAAALTREGMELLAFAAAKEGEIHDVRFLAMLGA